jgi:hypothetical protein
MMCPIEVPFKIVFKYERRRDLVHLTAQNDLPFPLEFLFVWWPSSTSIRCLAASLGYAWWSYNQTLLECLVSHLEYLTILSLECSSVPYPSISSTFLLYVFQFLRNFQALGGSLGAFNILSNFYVPSGTLRAFPILSNFYASKWEPSGLQNPK